MTEQGKARNAERLRTALRENLRRRKLQAKVRSQASSKPPAAAEPRSPDAPSTPAHESAGFGADKQNR